MSKQTEIVQHEDAPLAESADNSVGALLRSAVATLGGEGAKETAEAIRVLVELKREEDAIRAKRDFRAAFNAFQAECPQIPKDKISEQVTRGGGKRVMKYSALDTVDRVVRPLLIKHGFSYSWSSVPDGGKLAVTCTLGHIGGHEEKASALVTPDKNAPMNDSQRDGSTTAYGERYSLLMVLGLATTDDTNGAPPADREPLEEDQVAEIEILLKDAAADREKFLKWIGADSVPKIKQGDFKRACDQLRKKKDAK